MAFSALAPELRLDDGDAAGSSPAERQATLGKQCVSIVDVAESYAACTARAEQWAAPAAGGSKSGGQEGKGVAKQGYGSVAPSI